MRLHCVRFIFTSLRSVVRSCVVKHYLFPVQYLAISSLSRALLSQPGIGRRLCGYQTKGVKSDPMTDLMNDLFATEDRNYLYTNIREVFEAHVADTGPLLAREISELLYRLGKKKFRSEGPSGVVIDHVLAEIIIKALAPCKMNGRELARAMQLMIIVPLSSDEVREKIIVALTKKLHTGVFLNSIDLSMCLYALQTSKEEYAVLVLMNSLARRVNGNEDKWGRQEIVNALYGFQGMSSETQEVRGALKALTERIFLSDALLDSQGAGVALYGLQNMSSDVQEVRDVLKTLATKISLGDAVLDAQGISNSLYGLKNMSSDVQEVREVLKALANKICLNDSVLNTQGIGNALYGLQNMSSDVKEVRDILKALTEKISLSDAVIDAQGIGNALYGLQGMSSDVQEVREVLKALAEKISSSEKEIDSQGISNSFYGLQRMSSDVKEVKDIVNSLVKKISLSDAVLDSQGISNSLFGLQSMSSDAKEVKNALKALTRKLLSSDALLFSQGIGNSLYGLQGMSSSVREVRGVLKALTVKMSPGAVLDSRSIAIALYGLQNMSSDVQEVRDVLKALNEKITSSDAVLSPQGIGNSLYGLHNMSSDVQEVRDVLKALTEKISSSNAILSSQNIGHALYGLQRMSSDAQEVREFLEVFVKKIISSEAEPVLRETGLHMYSLPETHHTSPPAENLIKLKVPKGLQDIGISIFGLRNVELDNDWALVMQSWLLHSKQLLQADGVPFSGTRTLLQSLLLVSYDPRTPFLKSIQRLNLHQLYMEVISEAWNTFSAALTALPPAGFGSRSEEKHARTFIERDSLTTPSSITTNEYLFGFECDLVQRTLIDGETTIVNYEFDGIHHKRPTKKYFCHLRDEYLQTRGVRIIRKDIS